MHGNEGRKIRGRDSFVVDHEALDSLKTICKDACKRSLVGGAQDDSSEGVKFS